MTTTGRVHPRHDHRLPVIILTDQEEIEGVTTNISLGGMFVTAAARLAFGTQVQVRIRLPALKEDSLLTATVRWQRENGCGLQFTGPRAREVWALNQLFKR